MYRLIILLLLLSSCRFEEKKKMEPPECQKPPGTSLHDSIPITVYNFSQGRHVALWQQHKQTKPFPGQIAYSGCILTECNSGSIVLQWDQRTFCTVEMTPDTLFIKRLSFMALSPNLDMVHVPWLTTILYYVNDSIKTDSYLNQEVHYSEKDIERAFKRLDTTKWQTHRELGDSRKAASMMRFASQMMIAAISGSEDGEFYFYRFGEKFKPEGEYELWYKEMENILATYRLQQGQD